MIVRAETEKPDKELFRTGSEQLQSQEASDSALVLPGFFIMIGVIIQRPLQVPQHSAPLVLRTLL